MPIWDGKGDGNGEGDDDGDGDGDGAARAAPAALLGEEERPKKQTHRRPLRRQVSAAGEFDYQAIGNRASER